MAYSFKRYTPPKAQRRMRRKLWSKVLGLLPFGRGHKRAGKQPPIGLAGVQTQRKKKNFSLAKTLPLFVLFVLCLVGWGIYQLLAHTDIFRITELRLTGARSVTERQVLQLAGLQQGINLMVFNASAAEKKIATHPWVAEVRVKKQWPSGVLVDIREYMPFAMINQGGESERKLSYIDYTGHIIAEVQEGGSLDFPVINGAESDDIAEGLLVQGSKAEGALQLLHFAARGNALLPLQSVSEVRITADKGLVLHSVDHPFPIHFGSDYLQYKFNRLLQVLKNLYDSGEINQVAAIEMAYGDNLNKMLCRFVQPR